MDSRPTTFYFRYFYFCFAAANLFCSFCCFAQLFLRIFCPSLPFTVLYSFLSELLRALGGRVA